MMVTRVTNSMLSRTLLNNLSMNLYNMDKLQNQMATGRKYAHISDKPSALIYGQAARNKLARLEHYQATVSTAQTWLTQAESGVMELQKVIGNVYEELINAGGPKTDSDKKNIAMMVNQLRDHYLDTLNSSYGDRFVFAAYNTPGDYAQGRPVAIKPFTFDTSGNLLFNGFNVSQFDKLPSAFLNVSVNNPDGSPKDLPTLMAEWDAVIVTMIDSNGLPLYPGGAVDAFADFGITADDVLMLHQIMNDVIHFDVGPGITMPVTINGLDVIFYTAQDENGNTIMRNMFELLNEVYDAINGTDFDDPLEADELTKLIKLLQDGQNHLLVKTAELGGRSTRLELLEARYDQDWLNYTNMRSDAEDADMAEVIMHLKMAEAVYQASLSSGARIIQPTLMDFLR